MNISENQINQIVKNTIENLREKNKNITLKMAKIICERVQNKAEQMGISVVVAVYNSFARPVLIQCGDGAFVASFDIAKNKAYTASALKMHTKDLKKLAQPGGALYGIQNTNDGQIVIFGGGNVLKIGQTVVGAVGVSGGTEKEDTYLADYAERVFAEEIKCM